MFKKIFITNFYVRLNAWRHTKATRALCAVFVYVVILGAAPVFGTTIDTGQTVLTSTISGAITLNGGTLQADGTRTFPNGTSITINSGTIDANSYTLNFSSNSDSNLAGSGYLTLRDSGAGGKIILGAGGSGSAYSFPGSGLLYEGNLTIASGTVVGNVKNAASVTLNGTYDIGGSGKSLTNLSGFGTITNNGNGTAGGGTTNANISLTNTASSTFSGTIEDGIKFTNLVIKAGLYTQTLAGTSTYTGTTTLNSGILNISFGSIGSGGLIFTGGILQATSASAIPTTSNITVSGNNAIIDTMGSTNTIDLSGCTISQTYPLIIVGGGSVLLPNNSWTVAYAPGTNVTYSGGTVTNAAIISNILTSGIANTSTSTFGTNAIVLDGGTLQAGATCDIANLVYVDSNGGTIDPNGNVLNLSGGVLGPGALILAETVGSVIGDLSNVASVTVNGTYDINGSVKSLTNLTGTGTGKITNNGGSSGTIKLTNTADASFSGAISDGAGGSGQTNLVIDAGSFTQILAGTNTYTGTTLVKSGTVQFGSGATVPTSITLSGGTLKNNGNDFPGTTLTLASGTTSILDVNGCDVRFASALGASSGNLNIGDTASLDAFSSISKVYLGENYLTFTGVVGFYSAVALGDYPNYIPADFYFAYGDRTPTNLGGLPNAVINPTTAPLLTLSAPNITAQNGGISGSLTAAVYTPSGTFNGTDIVTCAFQDPRFYTSDAGIGGGGGTIYYPYPLNGSQTVNIHVAPPSAIPSGGITLTDVDFSNFGANFFGSTTAIHGITGVNGFTSASGTATLTVALATPQRIDGILANGAGTLNLSIISLSGSSTLTLGEANTYTGTTSIGRDYDASIGIRATLIGDISSSSGVAVWGTYDLHGSNNRTVAIDSSGANGLFTSTGNGANKPILTLKATANSNFAGTIDNTIGNLVISGPGTLTLTGTNAYTGTTKINTGATLSIPSIPNASAIIANTIDLSGGTLSVANGTSLASTQNISLSANSAITVGTNPGDSASTAGTITLGEHTLTITGGTLTMGSYPLTGTITPTLVWETSAPTTTFYTDYNTPLTSESLSVPSGGAGSANYTVTILYGSNTKTFAYGQSKSYTLPKGTLAVNGDGTFTYTPTGSSATTETFTYQITDASGLATNTISKDITINIATPITVNSAIVKGFNFSTGIKTFTGTFSGVASGGTGPYIYYLWDGATRQTSTTGTYGTASVNGVDFTYTATSVPAAGAQDIFHYIAYDANGLVSATPGILTLYNNYITGNAPTGNVPYNQSVTRALAVSGTGSGNYSYAVATGPTHGTLSGALTTSNGPGFTYTITPGYFGTDSFTYTVTDTTYGCSDTKAVTITTIPDLVGVSLTLTDDDLAIFSQNITNSTGTATLILNSASGSMNLSGNLSDGGNAMALSIMGEGATLSGNNTYSGGTTVFFGTLTVTSSSSAGTGDITFASGSVLNAVSVDGAPIILSNPTYFGLAMG